MDIPKESVIFGNIIVRLIESNQVKRYVTIVLKKKKNLSFFLVGDGKQYSYFSLVLVDDVGPLRTLISVVTPRLIDCHL